MTAANSVVGPVWDWADRLRKIRRTVACVSQADMAALLGVKPATYSAWEGGRHEPPMRVAFDVARRLEQHFPGRITAAWVLGLDSEDSESRGLLPRMDSNHQPPDCRFHAGHSVARLNTVTEISDFRFANCQVRHISREN